MLYPVFPNGPPGRGEWDREEANRQDTALPLCFPDFIFLSDLVLGSQAALLISLRSL